MLDSSVTISLKEKETEEKPTLNFALFTFDRGNTLMINLNPFTHA